MQSWTKDSVGQRKTLRRKTNRPVQSREVRGFESTTPEGVSTIPRQVQLINEGKLKRSRHMTSQEAKMAYSDLPLHAKRSHMKSIHCSQSLSLIF